MKLIDAHQHLWDPGQFSYSWTANHPPLNRAFRMGDYLAATKGIEVLQSVHVEADVDPQFMAAETRHILQLAEREDNPLSGVVAAARPEFDNFHEYIESIVGHPALKGVRRVLHTQPDELAITTTFVENVRSLEQYGLSFDLCVQARQLPIAINLVRECPEVQFILDHCGNPEIASGVSQLWREHLAQLASYPNVACKISGIVVNADHANWTAEDLLPSIEWTIECFGWDRVMFGSDWPVCTLASSLTRWVETLAALTHDAGEFNQRKLFSENARRLYRLD